MSQSDFDNDNRSDLFLVVDQIWRPTNRNVIFSGDNKITQTKYKTIVELSQDVITPWIWLLKLTALILPKRIYCIQLITSIHYYEVSFPIRLFDLTLAALIKTIRHLVWISSYLNMNLKIVNLWIWYLELTWCWQKWLASLTVKVISILCKDIRLRAKMGWSILMRACQESKWQTYHFGRHIHKRIQFQYWAWAINHW